MTLIYLSLKSAKSVKSARNKMFEILNKKTAEKLRL
jgi:hypothetical protein